MAKWDARGFWDLTGRKEELELPPVLFLVCYPTFITQACDRIQEHPHILAHTIRNLSAQPLIASWQLSDHDFVMPILYSLLTAPWKVCFENLSPRWPLASTHTPRQTLELSLYYTYTRINSLQATPLCFTFSAHCQECRVFACACLCVCHSLCVMPIAHWGGI